jgi:hypothetical protein
MKMEDNPCRKYCDVCKVMFIEDACFCDWADPPRRDEWLPNATPEFAATRKVEREAMLKKGKP